MEWQPIETAPNDTFVLLWADGYEQAPVARFVYTGDLSEWMWICLNESLFEDGAIWSGLGYVMPTHWMPMPTLPPGDKQK